LLILELGRIKCIGVYHECRGIENIGAAVGVTEMIEGRAIVTLDGSGVGHPGAHVYKVNWRPICNNDSQSAINI